MAGLPLIMTQSEEGCPLPDDSWRSWYWARQQILDLLQPLEAASGASGVEVGIMLSGFCVMVVMVVLSWWWRRRVKANEEDILVLTRRSVAQHTGRGMQMQSAVLEVFRCGIASSCWRLVLCVMCWALGMPCNIEAAY